MTEQKVHQRVWDPLRHHEQDRNQDYDREEVLGQGAGAGRQGGSIKAWADELVAIDNVMLERAEELRKQHWCSAGRPPDRGGQEWVRQQGRAV